MPNPQIISLTFDDGLRCQFERALPILNKHGFPATVFLVANTDSTHTDGHQHPDWWKVNWSKDDIDLIKGMIRRGHEIGAHSMTHRHPNLDNDARFEVEGSKLWIECRLGEKVESYCYPFFHFTDAIRHAVISAGYKQARWGARRSYSPEVGEPDLYKVDCRLVAVDNPETVQVDGVAHSVGRNDSENVEGWLQPDWYVLTFHGIGTIHDGWWPISSAEFQRQMEELAKYQDSGHVQIVTFKEGAERLRQRMNLHAAPCSLA